MQVVKVSASIRFSKDIGGSWNSVELSAEAAINHGEDWYQSQAELYDKLSAQLRDLWPNGNGTKLALPGAESGLQPSKPVDPATSARAHFCETHQVAFTHRQKDGESWYSHKIKNSSEWCTESP